MAGLVLAVGAAGCGDPDPRFVQASQVRKARIAGHVERFGKREAERPRRLAAMRERIARSVAEDSEQLRTTWSYIKESHEDDVRLWPGRRERTRQVIRRELRGDVEQIDRTIPNLFY
jgi:hypothetical protein